MATNSNTWPPTVTDTPTRVVRADDLTQALARVRMTYGKDALVLGTRTVVVRDPQSLRPRRQVEVSVADPAAAPRRAAAAAGGTTTPWAQAYAEASLPDAAVVDEGDEDAAAEPGPEVDERVNRLDGIAHRVRDLAVRLDTLQDDAGDYPLLRTLRAQGTSEETLQHLAGSFRLAARGGEASETAARRHLSRFVRGTKALDATKLRGEHWFLGRAGTGKTTLVLYLAGTLRGAGVPVTVAAVRPAHSGEVERLKSAQRALGIELVLVENEADMTRARDAATDDGALLVDTPCFIGQELPVRPIDPAQRHLVVPLGEDRQTLREHLEHARGWQADCLALTQMDLFPRPGRLVDLAVESGRPISLLQGRDERGIRVAVARGEQLLTAVLGEPRHALV